MIPQKNLEEMIKFDLHIFPNGFVQPPTIEVDSLNRCLHPLDLWIVGILGDGPCGSLDSSWWFQIVFFDSPKKP